MKIAASTFYGINAKTVLESVNELEGAGFDTIELMYEYNNFISEKEARQLKKKNLDYSMHAPFWHQCLTHPNADIAKPQIDLIEKSLEIAQLAGCTHYVLHGGKALLGYTALENPVDRKHFLNIFVERLGKILEQYTTGSPRVIIENMPSEEEIGGLTDDILQIQAVFPHIGFCFDIAHAELANNSDNMLAKIKIDYVHATDNNLKRDDHKAVGEGKIDYKAIIRKLKKVGFDGKIILENLSFEDCVKSRDNLQELIV